VGWFPKKSLAANTGYGPILFHLLPYLEQNPLYLSTRQDVDDKPVYVAWGAADKHIKVFMGPGDPTFEKGSDRSSYLVNELAITEAGTKFPSSFSDGTSQTIFVAEGYSQATDTVTFGGKMTTWKTVRRWWDNPGWKPVAGAVGYQVAPEID